MPGLGQNPLEDLKRSREEDMDPGPRLGEGGTLPTSGTAFLVAILSWCSRLPRSDMCTPRLVLLASDSGVPSGMFRGWRPGLHEFPFRLPALILATPAWCLLGGLVTCLVCRCWNWWSSRPIHAKRKTPAWVPPWWQEYGEGCCSLLVPFFYCLVAMGAWYLPLGRTRSSDGLCHVLTACFPPVEHDWGCFDAGLLELSKGGCRGL